MGTVQKTVVVPQLELSTPSSTSLLWRRGNPLKRQVPAVCAKAVDFPQVQFVDGCCLCGDVREEPSMTHSCELSRGRVRWRGRWES